MNGLPDEKVDKYGGRQNKGKSDKGESEPFLKEATLLRSICGSVCLVVHKILTQEAYVRRGERGRIFRLNLVNDQ